MDFLVLYERNFEKLDFEYLNSRLKIFNNRNIEIVDFCTKKSTLEEFQWMIKSQFLRSIESNFLKTAFQYLHKKIPLLAEHMIIDCFEKNVFSKSQFTEIFRHIYIWKKTEINESLFPVQIGNNKLLEMFLFCHKQKLISNIDKKLLADTQTIYRGTAGRTFDEARNAISWTTEKKIAEKFMCDYKRIFNQKDGFIISGCVNKNDIIAYFREDRYEYEIIINPKEVKNVQIITN